jgi:purine-binding chemotaxis protein CheW
MNARVQAQKHAVVATNAQRVEQKQSQYLTFMLSGETFAIGILGIKEIIEYDTLTVVPMMPECIRGVINLRGSVLPVIDLCARFGRKSAPVNKRTCIVIVEVGTDNERQDVGVIVDAVNEVLDIPATDIEPAPPFGAKIRTVSSRAWARLAANSFVILDINHVLSIEQTDAIAAVETGALRGQRPSADRMHEY